METTTLESLDEQEEQKVEKSTTVARGRKLTYAEYGCPDGVPVVFLHGTPGSRYLAKLFHSVSEECGVRLLAPDRPGFGDSSSWADRSVDKSSQFIIPVLDDANVDTVGLIAFSGGAPYALATAASSPERISKVDIVAGATPSTVTDDTPAMQRFLARLATTSPTLLGGLFGVQRWLAERRGPSFITAQYTAGDTTETVPDETAEIVKQDFIQAFANHRSGAVTEFRHMTSDWTIDYSAIESKVTLWHGENDTNVPISGVRRVENEIPTAELHVLDDADHLQTLLQSAPKAFARYR